MLDIDNIIEGLAKKFSSLDSNDTQHAYVSISLPLQTTIYLLPHSQIDHVYWHRPCEEYSVIGLGKLLYQTAKWSGRFKEFQHYNQKNCQQWQLPPIEIV